MNEGWQPRRIARDGPLILSIHIPKTAGTRFREILTARYGSAVAFYYGPDSHRTHPLLRVPPRMIDAAALGRLESEGVRVLHGHMRAGPLRRVVPDPSRYWIWLREPVEQTLSHYHFLRGFTSGGTDLARRIRETGMGVEAFVQEPEIRNHQTRFCGGLPLEDVGFLGVTEHFAALLPLLGLRDEAVRTNANPDKPRADLATRQLVARHMIGDVALYSLALEICLARLGVRERAPPPLLARLARHLPRRHGSAP